jgi:endonuclease YncB( thermonuclease family)
MIRALLLGLVGVASFAAVYLLVPAAEETGPPQATGSLQALEPVPAPVASAPPQDATAPVAFELRPGAESASAENETPARAIRDVTPDNMTAGPRITGTLVRVDPPKVPPPARMERLFNPVVADAGTIHARDRSIHLAGIAAPEFDARCGEGDKAWPCGRMARAALRSFIRGRAIECEIPAGAESIPDPAKCLVGGDDISEWLIAQGWAKRSGDVFEAVEKKAQDAKLGLWGDGRPDGQASEVATSG